ncbi:MAG: NADH:ubiquinone oxidoreductase [Bacteroidales bacterium]|jgi:Ni,Fe-hydrogenase III small subunit/NAD-dependent dihydropyrimidine dehydrogenase PreA subunit|nr:NADH:ubiquinone oxidoreductase [Bacteroidales bacterium]
MLEQLKILRRQGKQYIPDVAKVHLHQNFRGRPVISSRPVDAQTLTDVCPMGALEMSPVRLDLAKCSFCGLCARTFPEKISFTNDYRIATNIKSQLTVTECNDLSITVDRNSVRPEVRKLFRRSLKLRQVSAGGDNSTELELNACSNVNFDMGRFGIEFVASPRHADGVVITGPVTRNMAKALQICYDAIPDPKIIVLAGVDALSGGIFADSPAIDRSFMEKYHIDLYIPGNPPHPLSIINGLLDLCGNRNGNRW